jgi:hypothetical protein
LEKIASCACHSTISNGFIFEIIDHKAQAALKKEA